MGKLLFATLIATFVFLSIAHANDFPATSGMARLDNGQYLLVDDTKDTPENAHAPRLRVATLTPGHTTVVAVQENWGDNAAPNDLEAVCPIPGQPGHFLLSESGYAGDKYGRLFHIVLKQNGGNWSSQVASVAQLPTFLMSDVEGIALGVKADGTLMLVLSERGGKGPYSAAQLWWGDFDLASGSFTMTEDAQYGLQLPWPGKICFPWARPCTDLYVDGGGYLWASGAEDMGDGGPFRSIIYRIGKFDPKQSYPIQYDYNMDLLWHVDGLKVEALSAATGDNSLLTFATDDEDFGGVWRPLPHVEYPPQQPSYYGEAGG